MRATLLTLFSVICAAACTTALAAESKIDLAQLPAGSQAAVKAMFPRAKVKGAAREEEDNKTVYEITLEENGLTIDVTVNAEGKIQVIEREIRAQDLPGPVKTALDAKYPGATQKIIERVDRITDGRATLDFFELLLVTPAKETLEIQVLPDGKIKNVETKKPGDSD
jgi:hypothetical protein